MSHREEAVGARPLPRALGDFAVEALLGEGGSGTVYAARWGHRRVALKVLREDLFPDDKQRQRFLDEARLLAAVEHPGVVKVLGSGVFPDGRPYLAMEQLEGESLATRCARGPLASDEALAFFRQLAGAVSALHHGGLIHRDIKPENVIVTGGHAVLLDLGIARVVEARSSTISQEGGVRGTPDYMAPERFFGVPAGVATDVYELALLLYVMLAGRLPWERAGDPAARLNPPLPSAFGIAVAPALEAVLLSALSTRPEARPATVAALVASLGGEQPPSAALAPTARLTVELPPSGSRPSETPAPGPATTSGARPSRRQRRVLLAGAALLVLAAGGTSIFLALRRRDQPRARASDEPPTKVFDTTTGPGLPAPAPGIDGLLALHPKDSVLVGGVSLRGLRARPLVQSLAADTKNEDLAPLRALLSRCGDELVAQSNTLVITAGPSGFGGAPVDVSIQGAAGRDAVEHCVAALLGSAEHAAKLERSGATTHIGDMWLAAAARGVFLASSREERLHPSASARDAAPLRELLKLVDTSADGWFVMDAASNSTQLVSDMPAPKGLYLTLRVDAGMHLHGGLRFASGDDARSALQVLERELAKLRKEDVVAGMWLKDAKLAVTEQDVVLTFDLNEAMARITLPSIVQAFAHPD